MPLSRINPTYFNPTFLRKHRDKYFNSRDWIFLCRYLSFSALSLYLFSFFENNALLDAKIKRIPLSIF